MDADDLQRLAHDLDQIEKHMNLLRKSMVAIDYHLRKSIDRIREKLPPPTTISYRTIVPNKNQS